MKQVFPQTNSLALINDSDQIFNDSQYWQTITSIINDCCQYPLFCFVPAKCHLIMLSTLSGRCTQISAVWS